MSLKETLLAYKPKIVPVEGRYDMRIYVRVMNGAGRYQLEKKFQAMDKNNHLVETALVCVCDSEGELIFTAQDRPAINEMPSDLLQDIFAAALKVNKMTPEAQDEDVKHSETTTPENSGTN
tara:strand:- start:9018 stop:9380 length:363 start_codon:yes stop_codon:yes gene_type:complete